MKKSKKTTKALSSKDEAGAKNQPTMDWQKKAVSGVATPENVALPESPKDETGDTTMGEGELPLPQGVADLDSKSMTPAPTFGPDNAEPQGSAHAVPFVSGLTGTAPGSLRSLKVPNSRPANSRGLAPPRTVDLSPSKPGEKRSAKPGPEQDKMVKKSKIIDSSDDDAMAVDTIEPPKDPGDP